ncbi:MAG: NAD(P)H-binding protein [Actinomycetota bacterium]|nr:NAD(P)H-binding protein [Actinomycetota bacterium]
MTILVTGATGNVGRHVVAGLLGRGEPVRALTRDPAAAGLPAEVEVFAGDLSADEVPAGLLNEVSQVFLFPAPGGVKIFTEQASAAGVGHFVVLSSLAAAGEHERDHGSWSAVHHLEVEQAVAATGTTATILRPGSFATNLLFWTYPIKATGSVEGPYPTSAQAPVHEADVADVAVAALCDPSLRGATYPITGPEALTRVEQLAAIGRAIGRELAFREITPAAFAESMAQFMPGPAIRMLLDYWADTVTAPDQVRSVAAVTGATPRSLDQWAADHAADFS